MNPLVSIIVSCYNGAKYIAQTLNSLLAQTYSNIEIIVVNDGSTDNSEEVILSFDDPRLHYFKQENKGQCAALNFGFRKSVGQYIKFYDADDVLHPKVIAGQVMELISEPDNVISFIEWRRFYNNQLPTEIDVSHLHTIHRNCTPLEYILWQNHLPMVQCGLWLIPRALLLRTGLWDERLSLINDTEFFTRIFVHTSKLKFCEHGLTFYRSYIAEASLSSDFSKRGIKSAILSTDLSAKWLLQIENSEEIVRRIVKGYVMILEWAYPEHKKYVKIIERRLERYPVRYIKYTQSGLVYNLILDTLGWKAAKRVSKLFQLIKYNLKKR